MQILHFGLDFDNSIAPNGDSHRDFSGEVFCGPKKLLHFLEAHFGLTGYPENTDYLRIELYRQALSQHLQNEPEAFFAKSFGADRFATATALLEWRDELLLAGWDFEAKNDTPARLKTLTETEAHFRKKLAEPSLEAFAFGFADRFEQVLRLLEKRFLPVSKIVFYEPENLQPTHIQRFVKIVSAKNAPHEFKSTEQPQVKSTSDASVLQDRLLGKNGSKTEAKNDGSLMVLRAKRDYDAAVFLAQTMARNPDFRPVFLVPEMSLTLDQAMIQEGLPALGVLSASLARPSLQVLKLAPAFIWEPVDVFKIMEFVTLPVKPLDEGLSAIIAKVLAEKPGLFNDVWFAAVFGYLEDENVPDEARKQYEFWFDRRRYKVDASAPKRDLVAIYSYLRDWAVEFFEKSGGKNPSMLVLAEQARRIRDLLEAIPEARLTFLELERIVRTIYEPSPVQFAAPQKKHFEFVHSAGAFPGEVNSLIWWNCIHDDPVPTPDKWQPSERQFLENQGVALNFPKKKNDLRLFLRNRAVLSIREKLVLVVPEFVEGKEQQPNLLLGDIEAAFDSIKGFSFDLDCENDRSKLSKLLTLPGETFHQTRERDALRPHLEIASPEVLLEADYETPTSLESLFYYPHQWFFKQKTRLFSTNILSVTGDRTLLGNLAHRFFELLLKEDFKNWQRETVQDWILEKSKTMLEREGATLLLYGREPEKNQFLHKVQHAAWNLISILKKNGWEVFNTELDLKGQFAGIEVRGKADLVLRRDNEQAIVDLKWSGAKRREEMIKNHEDLQLVLYSKLLEPVEIWAHTAYFILESGKMIARNTLAFREAAFGSNSAEDHREANELIFKKMERTFQWRMRQIREGKLEIRNSRNINELDFLYADEVLDLLEMKKDPAKWDAFRTLIE